MKNNFALQEGESIAWQAKPAPRCYTFRHWRHSIFGLVFLAICSYWQVLGVAMAKEYETVWLAWLPLPFIVIGVYFAMGHLVQSRLEWSNVDYLITNRRVIVRRGLVQLTEHALELAEVTYFSLQMQGEQLGTLRIHQGESKYLLMHCLEYPQLATVLLEQAIARNQAYNDGV